MQLAREGTWVMAGQGVGAVGAVAVTCALAHWLPPAEVGRFALGMTASALGQSVLFGPWAGGAMRLDAVGAAEGARPAFIAAVLRGQLLLTVAAIACAAVAVGALMVFGAARDALLAAAAATAVIAAAWAYLASALQTARRQRAVVALHQGATPCLRLALIGACTFLLGATALAAMAGWALATLAVAASQWAFVSAPRVSGQEATQEDYRRRLVAFASPFMLWGLFSCAQAACDRWALHTWAGLDAVGEYSIAFQLGYGPAQFFGLVTETIVSPVAYSGAGSASDPASLALAHRRVIGAAAILAVSALACAIALALCGGVIRMLVPAGYGASVGLVAPLFLAGGLAAAAQVLVIAPLASLDPRRVIAPKIVVSIVALVALSAGAALAGVRGVVIAQVAVSALSLAWMLALVARTGVARA
jgi:O-antigen/teichoic acid export membrane protein